MTFRQVPAAITPVSLVDITQALINQSDSLTIFRQQLTEYFAGKQTYTFTSLMRATYACLLAIKDSKSIKNEVVIPRYSCPSFLHGIIASGLKVKYCDIDPNTLSINLNSLKSTLNQKTLAVIVTNLFGLSNPIEDIQTLCRQHHATVIETADYAHGSIYKNKPVGSFGDYTILNFQEGKAIPIGGAAVVERKDNKMLRFEDSSRQQSSIKYILVLTAFSIFSRPFFYGLLTKLLNILKINRKQLSMEDTIRQTKSESDFKLTTSTLHSLSNFQASLGIILLKQMPQNQAIRFNNAQKISHLIIKNKKVTSINPLPKLSKIHYIRYPILTPKPQQLCNTLMHNGIEASRMYIEHGMNIDKREFPGAYQIAHQLLTLPCHPYINNKDLLIIKQCI